jgi:hypothetical protein
VLNFETAAPVKSRGADLSSPEVRADTCHGSHGGGEPDPPQRGH